MSPLALLLTQVAAGHAETRQYEHAIEYSHRLFRFDPLRAVSH